MKRTYTLNLSTHDIRSSYHLLIYPRASELPSLLPIRDVSYTSRKQLPIQDAHVSRKISCLTIRVLPTLIKTSCLAIRNTFLAKTSCSRQSFTHFARDFNLSQGNDLKWCKWCKHNQIKLDDQSSKMYMLNDNLEYAFNTQTQDYLEIKTCKTIRTKVWIFNISH